MIKDKRKNIKIGDSIGITLPANLSIGEYSTLAGDRLILIDPRAEFTEQELLEFMEKYVEPHFWEWKKNKQNNKKK